MVHGSDQQAIGIELASRTRGDAALAAQGLGSSAGIGGALAQVASQLTTDGAGRTLQDFSDGSNAKALLAQAGEGDTVLGLELAV